MNGVIDVDRRAILRHNALWCQASSICTTICVFALVALISLLAIGIALTSLTITALLATGAVGIGLNSFVLRFVDHSV